MADTETTTVEQTTEETTTTEDDGTTASEETTSTSTEQVDWKQQSRKHEREKKKAREEADQLRAKLAEIEQQNLSDQEKAIAKAREEAAAEARGEVTGTYRDKLLKAEVRAQAAGKFANPDIAFKLLDLGDDAFTDDGDPDAATIAQAIDEYLEQEPYLKADGAGRKPQGGADGGRGSGAGKDLEDLSPEDWAEKKYGRK